MLTKEVNRQRRKRSIRKQVFGTTEKPRVCVYRSNKHIEAQIIDDTKGQTLVAANDLKIDKGTNQEKAAAVGKELATLAKKKKINNVIFDRNGYKFHGRVKALADAAREAGLKF